MRFPEGPLTILFSDVEGSTDLRTRRGDAAAHRLLRAHEDTVRACVAGHDGREIKALGDGFMVAFASARKALACARTIQQRLDERNRASPGEEIRVRIGINTGEVIVEGDDLYGQAVNAAARIAGRAQGGEILVSDVVRRLVGTGPEFSFRDRGRLSLKGFPERWRLYSLVVAGRDRTGGMPLAGRTPFVGRDRERGTLRHLVDRAAGGHGGLVLVAGEPGVGKTRLAEEVAADAGGRFRVLVGHCYESGRDLPYLPWVELIEAAMATSDPDELRRLLGEDASELARLVPELRRLLPGLPPPVELPPEQQRRYTFNAIREFVGRAARTEPRLYVLEDLHWADEPSLLLLEHLAERLAGIPCVVIGTHRHSPSDVTPQLAETLGRLVRARHTERVHLSPHSEDEVERLLAALSGQAPPEELRAAIYAETEGNVFFVEEVFRHLAETGRLFDEEGRFRTDVPVAELDVPANVRLVIERRLERLAEATDGALSVAAVAGRHLPFRLWEAVAPTKGDDLIDAIDEAERAGLIVTEATGDEEEYWFAHELIRQTLLARIPAARRRQYHLRVARALEALASDDPAGPAATIVAHLLAAGRAAAPADLFRYLVLAGSRSLVSAAFEDGLRHLRRAAALADHAAPPEQAEMLFHLGTAERMSGRVEEAIGAWNRAIDLYRNQGDLAAIGHMCPLAAWNLAGGGRLMDADHLAQRGLAALGDAASADRARLLVVSGFCLAGAGRYEAGMSSIGDALALAQRLCDSVLAGYALGWKAASHHMHMESAETMASGLRAAEILRPAGEPWLLSTALAAVVFSAPGAGRFADARRLAAEALPVAERLGNHTAMMMCGRGLAMVDWSETGDLDALEAFARRDMQLCREAGLPWVSWSWSWRAVAAFHRGDWEAALRHAEQAAELSPPTVINGAEWSLRLEYLAASGRHDEATELLADRRAELPRLGQPTGWGGWAMLWGSLETLLLVGHHDAAAELYPLVLWCIERTGSVALLQPDVRLLQRAAGMAAAAGGDWDAAEAHFTTALRQAGALPHRPEQGHIRRFYGATLLRRGRRRDREQATRLLGQAEALYGDMGMPRHRALVREMKG